MLQSLEELLVPPTDRHLRVVGIRYVHLRLADRERALWTRPALRGMPQVAAIECQKGIETVWSASWTKAYEYDRVNAALQYTVMRHLDFAVDVAFALLRAFRQLVRDLLVELVRPRLVQGLLHLGERSRTIRCTGRSPGRQLRLPARLRS